MFILNSILIIKNVFDLKFECTLCSYHTRRNILSYYNFNERLSIKTNQEHLKR